MSEYKTLTFKNNIKSIGILDKTIILQQALEIPYDNHYYIRLIEGYISNKIPNIYKLGSFNNGLIRVYRDVEYIDIQLPNGIYSVTDITNAIAYSLLDEGWINNSLDSPIKINANNVTNQLYIVLDSSKLNTIQQIKIDLTQSDIYLLLGYESTSIYDSDGTYTSINTPNMDWNTHINIFLDFGGNYFNIVNDRSSNLLYSVCMESDSSIIKFPQQGLQLSYMPIKNGSTISQWGIRFQGNEHENTPLVFLECDCVIYIEIIRL
jgi:hypothetical protein